MPRPQTTYFFISLLLLCVLAAADPNASIPSNGPVPSAPQSSLDKLWNWLKLPKRKIDSTEGDSATGDSSATDASNASNKNQAPQTLLFDDNAAKGKLNNPAGGQMGAPTVPPLAPSPGPSGQSGNAGNNHVKIPNNWIPICWIIDPRMPADTINSLVKGVVDGFGQCDIAVEPYVFRVPYVPDNPSQIIAMSKTACPLNKIFGVNGSAVQVAVPYQKTADTMCKDTDPNSNVAGCAELGNGASGVDNNQFKAGNYGSAGQKGVPATNILDIDGWSQGVACHELGHNIGGPGKGGNFLLNENEQDSSKNAPKAGMGLELQVSNRYEIKFYGGEGDNVGSGGCNFTQKGCQSLQGGSNKNDGTHVWDPTRDYYYYDRPDDPPSYVFDGKSFFDAPIPKPAPPTVASTPPDRPQLFMDDYFNSKDSAGGPNKNGVNDGVGRGHPKKTDPADTLLSALGKQRGVVPASLGNGTANPSVRPDADGKASTASLMFDDEAGKAGSGTSAPSSASAGEISDPELSPGNGSGSSSPNFGFDESAAKGGGGNATGGGSSAKGNSSALGTPSTSDSTTAMGTPGSVSGDDPLAKEKKEMDEYNDEFWKKIGRAPASANARVKGSTLRGGGSPGEIVNTGGTSAY